MKTYHRPQLKKKWSSGWSLSTPTLAISAATGSSLPASQFSNGSGRSAAGPTPPNRVENEAAGRDYVEVKRNVPRNVRSWQQHAARYQHVERMRIYKQFKIDLLASQSVPLDTLPVLL
jgi:hypothetical protein